MRLLLPLLFLNSSGILNSQSVDPLRGGLVFSFRPYNVTKGLHLLEKNPVPLNQKITAEFDLMFDNAGKFGVIAKFYWGSEILHVIYQPAGKPDTSYIRLVYNRGESSAEIVVLKNELPRNRWRKASVSFSPSSSEVTFTYMDKACRVPVRIPGGSRMEIHFGNHSKVSGELNEYAFIGLRDVRVKQSGGTSLYHWPLREVRGNTAAEIISGENGRAVEPEWMMNNHFLPKENALAGPFPALLDINKPMIAYNKLEGMIYFVHSEGMYIYDTRRRTGKSISYAAPDKKYMNDWLTVVYHPAKRKMLALYDGGGKVTEYNEADSIWVNPDFSQRAKGHYYFSRIFYHEADSGLYSLGGYGWYTRKNYLRKYDFNKQEWDTIRLKGSEGYHWYEYSIAHKSGPVYYLYARAAQLTERQEDSYRLIYTLFEMNIETATLRKLGVIKEGRNRDFRPAWAGLYDSLTKHIYFTGYEEATRSQALLAIDPDSLEIKTVSSLKTFKGRETAFIPNVWNSFDSMNREFAIMEYVYSGADSFYVRISTLHWPPLTEAEYRSLLAGAADISGGALRYILLSSLMVLLGSAGIVFYLRRGNGRAKDEGGETSSGGDRHSDGKETLPETKTESPAVADDPVQDAPSAAALYLFGDFTLLDDNGINITQNLSPKLKQLFLMLFERSCLGSNGGMRTEAVTATLWPELSIAEAKNNRNVSLRRLRTALAPVRGAEIKTDNNRIKLILPESFYCDLLEFRKYAGNGTYRFAEVGDLRSIVTRGELFADCDYEWFDAVRQQYREETVHRLREIITLNRLSNHEKLDAAECILSQDSVCEIGIRAKVQALSGMGDHSSAKTAFEVFKRAYHSVYDTECRKNIADFLQ
ncbi:MAG: hypothetical protein FMNOHCHN_02706 [Ignavibacteriaceae bacterium]|nr:hypothetical protein [Ignavibacteriaceae bacterium]